MLYSRVRCSIIWYSVCYSAQKGTEQPGCHPRLHTAVYVMLHNSDQRSTLHAGQQVPVLIFLS
jgi:hypothetical protein